MLSRKRKTILKAPVAVTPTPEPQISNSPTISRPSSSSNPHPHPQQFSLGAIKNSTASGGGSRHANTHSHTESKSSLRHSSFSNSSKLAIADPLGSIIPSFGSAVSNKNDLQREKDLRKLVHALNSWDTIQDQTLCSLITEFKRYADQVDEKMNPVLQKLWSGNWPLRSKKVVTEMETLLSELLVAHPSFVGTAVHSLASKFLPPITSTPLEQPDTLSLNEQKLFSIAHRNLERIFSSFPMKQETSIKTFESIFPYMGKGPHIHYCYVHNLLKSMEYIPHARGQLLRAIIHKLIRIDVNISKTSIENMANNSVAVKSEDGGQDIFSMDLEQTPPENSLIETMDVCLNQMFQYFSEIFKVLPEESDAGEYQKEEHERNTVFSSLISIFEQELLPTFGMNNVPLLYIFVLHLQPSYITNFLDFLWKKANNVNTPTVIRIQTMCYLSGLLARSKSISIKTVKRWLTKFAEWANAYVDQKVATCHWSSVNPEAHGAFYAVCQAIFFVFSFRNKELIASRKCLAYTRTLNLGRLVTSDLNPLKACSRRIAILFVEAAHHHQISYCRTVLERNQEATIPTIASQTISNIGSKPELFALTQLESFLPFEESLLMRSKVWINSILRDYEPYYEELKVEKVENPDEDSIEMELGSYNDKKSLTNFYCNGRIPYKCKSEIKAEMEIDGLID